MRLNSFARYAWGVLVVNLGVVLWGAYVRATHSGAGCGSHWPLCNGEVIPLAPTLETIVEFTHRATSGIALLLVLGMLLWAWRAYPKGHRVRLGAGLSTFFIITEALVGALLVRFEWVTFDVSMGRVISMGVHLVNTFLLLAALMLTAWWASGGAPVRLRGQGVALWAVGLGLLGVLVIGVTGAITALGDTVFPASSLSEAIRDDFSPAAHFLIRLRVIHPLVAILVGMYLIFASGLLAMFRGDQSSKRSAIALSVLVLIQFVAGAVNVILLVPVAMQLIHLLLADMVWLTLVLFSANTLAAGAMVPADEREQPAAYSGQARTAS